MKTIKELMSEEFDKKIPKSDYKVSLFESTKYKIWCIYKSFIQKLGD